MDNRTGLHPCRTEHLDGVKRLPDVLSLCQLKPWRPGCSLNLPEDRRLSLYNFIVLAVHFFRVLFLVQFQVELVVDWEGAKLLFLVVAVLVYYQLDIGCHFLGWFSTRRIVLMSLVHLASKVDTPRQVPERAWPTGRVESGWLSQIIPIRRVLWHSDCLSSDFRFKPRLLCHQLFHYLFSFDLMLLGIKWWLEEDSFSRWIIRHYNSVAVCKAKKFCCFKLRFCEILLVELWSSRALNVADESFIRDLSIVKNRRHSFKVLRRELPLCNILLVFGPCHPLIFLSLTQPNHSLAINHSLKPNLVVSWHQVLVDVVKDFALALQWLLVPVVMNQQAFNDVFVVVVDVGEGFFVAWEFMRWGWLGFDWEWFQLVKWVLVYC